MKSKRGREMQDNENREGGLCMLKGRSYQNKIFRLPKDIIFLITETVLVFGQFFSYL